MSIPGPLYKELHAALLDAFSRDELTMLVRTRLDANFEALTADKNLTNQIDELLRWAERSGRLRELVACAVAERPRNAALQAIAAELAALPDAAFAPRLPGDGWRVPFPRNEQFVGRADDLAALHAALQQGAAVGIRPAGLTGLGGIGKTQLAVEYCYRFRDAYAGGVFWLNAAGEWLPAFAELGRFFDEELDGKALDRQARAVTAYFADHPDSLLVLDNVQDPAQLRVPVTPELTPAHLPCRVIFTTRRRDLGDAFTPVELSVLPEAPGLRLLLRHPLRQPALDPAHPEHDAALEIYRILGGLPLALEIAGAHLGRLADRPIVAYRDELLRRGALAGVDDPRGKINEADLGTRHAAAVEATLAEQWVALQSDDARLLLRVAGQFAEAEAIPAARLGLLAAISDRDTGFFGAPLALALDELHDAALVEWLAGDTIRLHPLVRDFAARRTAPDDANAFRNTCAGNLLAAYRDFVTLEDHCARRGVEALEADLLAALTFARNDPNLQSPISHILRMLQRESHALRDWDRKSDPGAFARQWQKRTLIDGDGSVLVQNRGLATSAPQLSTVWLTSTTSASLERTLAGHNYWVRGVATTPDGEHIISASDDNTIRMWNLSSGAQERIFTGHTDGVLAVATTPDARRMISASYDHTLKMWDIHTGAMLFTLSGHDDGVRSVAVTPNGRLAVSASYDHTLKLWDLVEEKLVFTLVGHSDGVRAVQVTPDGRRAVSASYDSTLKIWNLATGSVERTLTGHRNWVRAVAITPDGHYAISGSDDRTLKLWNLETGSLERTFKGHLDWVRAVAVTPDGLRFISGSDDRTLRVWNLATGAEQHTLIGHSAGVLALAVSPDGQRIVSASDDRTLRIWNLTANATQSIPTAHRKGVRAVAVTSDGRRIVSGSDDHTLKIWQLGTGANENTLLGHESEVSALALSPDGESIISASHDRTIRVWSLQKGTEQRILTGHSDGVRAVVVAGNEGTIVSASDDRTLRVWNLSEGTSKNVLIGHKDGVRSVATIPNDQRVISASYDRTLRIWDLANRSEERVLSGHSDGVIAVAVTPDGKYCLSASYDNTIRLWDVETGAEKYVFVGHNNVVRSVVVTNNGNRIVSASDDSTLRVWDLDSGQQLTSIVLESGVTSVAVAPDGVTIVAGDAVGNIYCLRYQEPTADTGKPPI